MMTTQANTTLHDVVVFLKNHPHVSKIEIPFAARDPGETAQFLHLEIRNPFFCEEALERQKRFEEHEKNLKEKFMKERR